MKKVVIGLSGGVDSAVACYLLKQQNYDVVAIYMQNWDSYLNHENYDNHKDKCDSQYEWEDAQKIASHLGVPIYKVDFVKEYWDEVFTHFIKQYQTGKTPNPDVLCNKYIKFGHLWKYAKEKFNCDFLATGHYAKVLHFGSFSELHMAKDTNKDQTYFLCDLSQLQIQHALFPLENLNKTEVRELAKQLNISVWDKKDSTGICFIGERNFKNFLTNYIKPVPGKVIDIVTKKELGVHNGVFYYTLGQNDGLGLGGLQAKYFVCQKDIDNHILYVVDEQHKKLFLNSNECTIDNFNWISIPKQLNDLSVRFRHRQKLISCRVMVKSDNRVVINYPNGDQAVAPGQYAVIYDGTQCLGGGEITNVILTS